MIKRVGCEFDSKSTPTNPISKFEDIKEILKNGFIELLGENQPLATNKMYYAAFDQKQSLQKEEGKTELEIPVAYEYVWSVGLAGQEGNWYDNLVEDDSIVIQLIFRSKASKYSIREIAADLKQVPPFMKKDGSIASFIERAGKAMGVAGKVVELSGFSGPGKIISALSELNINTVPTEEFRWYVKSFSFEQEAGIEWHIPKNYLERAGNRIVGTLAVYFIECPTEGRESEQDELKIEIRAFLNTKEKGSLFICPLEKGDFKDLEITPNSKTLEKKHSSQDTV